MIRNILVGAVVVAALVALLLWSQWRSQPYLVSGYIEAHDIRIGSRVGGRVSRTNVEEGQAVTAGQVLVELEPFDLTQRRDQASATCDQLQAQLDELVAGPRPQEIDVAKAALAQAEAELELATRTHDRLKSLVESDAESREKLDQATAQLKTAVADVEARRQGLALLQEGTRHEQIDAARAQLASVKAALAAINQQIDELSIRAPVDGIVETIELCPGDLVAANAPVISLLDRSLLWVRVYVPENHLDLHLQQKVSVAVDSYPGRRFAGTVTFIAQQAEFTPGNIQTPEERSKQVYRIKVTLDAGQPELRPGMQADIYLDQTPPTSPQPQPAP
jgi:membrane fusion protein YbhG